MASTYSTNLALELIGTGDQAGTWGNTTNTNLGTLIEQAISGYVTQAVSTGTDTTITIPNGATGVARNMFIELTGTGGTNTNLIVPANKKLYFIYNNASGAVTVKVSGQTGVSVAAGAKVILVSNGTDIVTATSYTASGGDATFSSLTISGGTANGVLYLNGSKVATSGSALTFDGTRLTSITGKFGGGAASNSASLMVNNAANTATGIQLFQDSVESWIMGMPANSAGLAWSASGSEYMRLTSTGLGIGTSSPSGRLDVLNSGVARLIIGASGSSENYYDANSHFWRVPGGATELARLTSSGNLGLSGGNAPTQRLSLYASGSTAQYMSAGNSNTGLNGTLFGVDGTGNAVINNTQNFAMLFSTNNTERARITDTGNLLVGTTTDVTGLSGVISDVAGNVRAIPRSGAAKTSAYTLAITDVGEFIELGTGGAIVVPNGIFSTGDVVSVFNNTSGARPISLTITTAYQGGTDSDKAVLSLATRGVATILFISNSVCVVNGNVS